VSFQVATGSIHGIVGDNSSGRHTLMKILAGCIRRRRTRRILYNGQVLLLQSRAIDPRGDRRRARRGGVFDSLS